MPKKLTGENSKAAAARARKAAVKEEELQKKQKALEDEYWKDDDKSLAKKQQKKEEQERKRQDQLAKKAIAKALIEEEVNSIKASPKQPTMKVTRAQVMSEVEKRSQASVKPKPQEETHINKPLVENINRLSIDGDEARTVDEAITILSSKSQEVDLHPEKRLKAAFTAYEQANMPRIKEENPTLRLSQLKQILKKDWMKSPDNPLNQRY